MLIAVEKAARLESCLIVCLGLSNVPPSKSSVLRVVKKPYVVKGKSVNNGQSIRVLGSPLFDCQTSAALNDGLGSFFDGFEVVVSMRIVVEKMAKSWGRRTDLR